MPQAKHSPMVIAAARELCKRHAADCNVDFDDSWKFYGDDHLADAQATFDAAGVMELVEALREILAINEEGDGTFRKRGGTRRGLSVVAAKAALTRATGV